jgi:hypothetical protein
MNAASHGTYRYHAAVSGGRFQHQVRREKADMTLGCEFCKNTRVWWDYPTSSPPGDPDPWWSHFLTCQFCHELIERKEWALLYRRYEAAFISSDPEWKRMMPFVKESLARNTVMRRLNEIAGEPRLIQRRERWRRA